MEAALAGWRGGDRSRMHVTSLVPQRSPTSGGLLRFLAAKPQYGSFGAWAWGLSGGGPARPLFVADNSVAFGVTPLVGGIVVRPLYPLGVWLKNHGSPISVDDICGCRFPPWRHRYEKPTPPPCLLCLFFVAFKVVFEILLLS